MEQEFENRIQYQFQNKSLLQTALTHSSYVNENNLTAPERDPAAKPIFAERKLLTAPERDPAAKPIFAERKLLTAPERDPAAEPIFLKRKSLSRLSSNERLEFLGDAVLELVVSRYLYDTFPYLSEGELTKYRAGIVCEPSLAKKAADLKIGENLLLSKGEEVTGGRRRNSTTSDALEALIGAIYLDGGLESAQDFILRLMAPDISRLNESDLMNDCKTFLQEYLQKNSKEPAVYEIVNMTGPAHDKEFTAIVRHENRILGQGSGKTKKEAEQSAAYHANLRIIRTPPTNTDE